jgi:hypothetical protein
MPYTNPWVGYLDRGYREIKKSLLTRLVAKAPEITDHSETNILVILISMFAGIAEMLGLYIDNMAREAFIQTAERFTSGVRLVKLIDYRVKAAIPATVDITVVAVDNNGDFLPLNAPYTIPAFTIFTTQSGIPFVNLSAVNLDTGSLGAVVPCKQITILSGQVLGTSDGITASQQFSLGTSYAHGSVDLEVAGVPFTELHSLGLATSTDNVFIVEVAEDGNAYVIFGDGINGAIPPYGSVVASYHTTLGVGGNVDEETIKTSSPTLTLPTAGASTTKIYNVDGSSGGVNYEGIQRLRVSAPLSLRTLDRAVTYQDYEDITRLAPGVGLAKVDFNCGKYIDIYIAPQGGGLAAQALLDSTYDYLDPRRMITTFPRMKAAGVTRLAISAEVTAKFRADVYLTKDDVQNALIEFGAFENQAINRKVRMSDIVAKLDNLARVDFLTLTGLSTIPYARPTNNNLQLDWSRSTLSTSKEIISWKVNYNQIAGRFGVFRNEQFMGDILIGDTFTDPLGSLTCIFNAGPYSNGDSWRFKTYPFLKDLLIDDFSVPFVDVLDLDITVLEQFSPAI